MNNLKRLSLIVLLLGLVMCARSESPAPKKAQEWPAVGGQLIVQTSSDTAVTELKNRFDVSTVDAENGVYLLSGANVGGHEEQLIQELSGGPFAIVERNYQVTVDALPRDPKWLEMWSLKNYGQDATGGTEGARGSDIKAVEAWKTTTGSKDILVAVLDTGIDYTHPDLKENIWVNQKEKKGTAGIDDDGNGYVDDIYGFDFTSHAREKLHYGQVGDPDPMDDHSHGTHVAGTIGAVGNNGVGVTGINWNVSIMALKFLTAQGSGTTVDEYRALRYALKMGVDVINASYGGGGPSKLIESTLRELGEKGTLFVAAAGNESANNDEDPRYPANYDVETILTVAATDNRDSLADFSCYGFQTVDIAAPGVAILSTYPVEIAKKDGVDMYQVFSGTSMATPHMVGAAALVLAANPGLKGKPKELKKKLMASVDWLPQLAGRVVSGGRINLEKAVKAQEAGVVAEEPRWVEETVDLATPRNPSEKIEFVMKVHRPGAKQIQLHLRRSVIDDFDFAGLFDVALRPVVSIPSLAQDMWLPPVQGDTAYLKFSNAMVAVQRFAGERELTDEEMEMAIKKNTAALCLKNSNNPKWICYVYDAPTAPFANFRSDGVEIDRVRYVPGTSGGAQ
ncbi:MAG: S8 family peptidase [Bdellovibrionia bacterium]